MPILKREADCHPPDLFVEPRPWSWRVAYVRARNEKALVRHLIEHRVPVYLPQRESRVRRQGRVRSSWLPLFPGYVFFGGERETDRIAWRSDRLVQVLRPEDGECLDTELAALWALQCSGAPLIPHPYLEPGDWVEIAEGPLKGHRGVVLREKGATRLVVSVSFLRRSVSAEMERDEVTPVLRRVG